MPRRLHLAFAAMAAIIAAIAFTASPASASTTEAPASVAKVQQSGADDTTTNALCAYQVNYPGGIFIYSAARQDSARVGSFPNGHVFVATCDNVRGGRYPQCGDDTLWKFVSSGYVKTKCLIRL